MATVLLLFITLLTGSWFLKGLLSRSETRSLPLKTGAGIDPQRSYLLPGRMSHVRLRPKVHRFTYSYLMVGIAVRNQSSNWLLSIGKKNWWQRGWLQVLAADHLGRGNDSREIEHKVDSYIAEQGLDPSCFPHVFLVTSPRVLWYKFGPASFWYLYSEHQVLKALIVEVNNTFGERRIYFVKADTKTERPLDSVSLQKAVPFRSTWSKDFHVSPFSSRKGSYSLSAWDPYDTKDDDSRHRRNVDIVATLLSSKDEPKLVARLWSDGSPLDVTNVPVISAVGFLSLWGWVGLMTYARIVREALILGLYHRLHIWYRPEPRQTAVCRIANSSERSLASYFVEYLKLVTSQGDRPACVNVVYPLIDLKSIKIESHSGSGPLLQCELRVLTPRFFTQALMFDKLSNMLQHVMLQDNDENRTVTSDRPLELYQFFANAEQRLSMKGSCTTRSSGFVIDGILAPMLGLLRPRYLPTGLYPIPGLPSSRKTRAGAGTNRCMSTGTSFMDDFVMSQSGDQVSKLWYGMVAALALLRIRVTDITGGE